MPLVQVVLLARKDPLDHKEPRVLEQRVLVDS